MRISLEVVRSDDGVLTGTAEWGDGSPRPFHGTLELLAILETAPAQHVDRGPTVQGGA